MNIEIANRLFEFRKKNNLSQEELAAKIGVSRQAVSKWERAESSPDTDNLIGLAGLYNVSLDELLFTNEPINVETKEEKEKSDFVSIGLNGIHVIDKDGSEVHIGLKGINVKNKSNSDFDEDIDKSWDDVSENLKTRLLKNLPIPIIVTAIYLILGFVFDAWHPAWILFLLIPLYYGFVSMLDVKQTRKRLNRFPVAIFCVITFLAMGFFFELWATAWIVFFIIPIYYSVVNAIFKKE